MGLTYRYAEHCVSDRFHNESPEFWNSKQLSKAILHERTRLNTGPCHVRAPSFTRPGFNPRLQGNLARLSSSLPNSYWLVGDELVKAWWECHPGLPCQDQGKLIKRCLSSLPEVGAFVNYSLSRGNASAPMRCPDSGNPGPGFAGSLGTRPTTKGLLNTLSRKNQMVSAVTGSAGSQPGPRKKSDSEE